MIDAFLRASGLRRSETLRFDRDDDFFRYRNFI